MGSLYKRSDGYWVASLVAEGRRIVRYDKTEAGAKVKLAEIERQAALGHAPPPNVTVGELIERWIETESARWKPRTSFDYRRIADRLILPELGRVRVAKLSPDRLQRFLDGLREHPRQANTVYRTLHRAFVVGMRWGFLHSNPCDRVVAPTYRAPRITIPTVEAVERFLSDTRDHRIWPWMVLAITTGLRPGEQASLRWGDINWDAKTMTVHRSGAWIDGVWTETEPKTNAGLRTIALGELSVTALHLQQRIVEERRRSAGDDWNDHYFVFPGLNGRPMWLSNLSPVLSRLTEAHGLGRLTPHKLRHLHASVLLNEKVPLPLVSRRLGHANPQITASIYSHAVAGDDMAADAIERALDGLK